MAEKPPDSGCSGTTGDLEVDSVSSGHLDLGDAATGSLGYNPQYDGSEDHADMDLSTMEMVVVNFNMTMVISDKDKDADLLHPSPMNARDVVSDIILKAIRMRSFRH
ncbi:hypothetical protein AMTRI_Chr13g119310 [Amborella trichopoda]|uniref:Uncharacterized protein n=1 Tax=Amborella trichopoda TaxID=13333 RepID=W1PDJ6_AMBTC|nr:hypothetical protein AMTR_s00006p00180220 [Amborella trichopoda]